MATASTGTAMPIPMARASRWVDDAAKAAPRKSQSVTSAAAEKDDDDDDDDDDAHQSHVSGLIDHGADEQSQGDSRALLNQQQV